jgi:aryl-alcohol dehydrogenase
MGAVVVGCSRIIAVDIKTNRLKLARELGATHIVNAAEVDPVETIREMTCTGCDYSLEAVGSATPFRHAVDSLKVPGTCGLTGSAPFGTEVTLDMNAILFGCTVRGVVEGDSLPDIFIPRLIGLYRRGLFPFDKLITFYSFEQINQACVDSEHGAVVKPVLTFDANQTQAR